MLGNKFVIDGVVHPFNMRPDNSRNGLGGEVVETVRGLQKNWNPPELVLPDEMYDTDWTVQQLSDTMFRETNVDIAVNHHLPLYSWFHDGSVSRQKNIELVTKWPQRYLCFAGIDPTSGTDNCMRNLDAQIEEMPAQIHGLKLYPSQLDPTNPRKTVSFRLDDDKLMAPIYERCLEAGIKTVAVHKATPNGPIAINPFRLDDIDDAARTFVDLNFEIVHSGLAFLDETAQAIARFGNVYANFETTTMLLMKAPGWFEQIFATLAFWGGYEKLIFSSGTMYTHAQPILELFEAFAYSEETMAKFNLPQVTEEDKANFLGLNYARMMRLDVQELKAGIKGDEYDVYQQANGLDAPLSNWKSSFAGA
ncbi:MAG: amidohydrolase [Pseudonocardiales bacterium]|nr:amidohydrolase [Pseudonocardiales bacterium]